MIAALLILGAGSVVALYLALAILHPGEIVEYGFSAFEPGPFENFFLSCYRGLALPATLGFGAALALLLPARKRALAEPVGVSPKAYLLVALAFLLVLAAKFLVLHNAPTMDDENVYHFTAQLLLKGKLVLTTGLPTEFIAGRWGIVCEDGKLYGMYPHGWPLLLALGYLAHLSWLINPLLAVAVILLAADFARRAYGANTAMLAMLLFATAPFFILTSATDLSQPAVALGVVGTVAAAVRYSERSDPRWLWLCGAAGGLAFLVRQLTAVGLLAPFFLYLVWRIWKERRLSRIVALAVPLLAAAIIYLALNHATTGNALEPGYTAFLRMRGVKGGILGFGTDYTAAGDKVVHTVGRGFANAFLNLARLNIWLLGWPLSLLPVILARPNLWTRLVLAAVGLQLLLYVGFFNPGLNLTGPTYYYEAGSLLLVLAADGLLRLGRWYQGTTAAQTAPRAPEALAAAILLVNLAMFAPTYARSLYHMTEGSSLLYRSIRQERIEELSPAGAVIFVRNVQAGWAQKALYKSFVFHPRTNASLEDRIVFLNDLGPEKNGEALRKYFPGRRGIHYGVGGDWKPQWNEVPKRSP